MDEAIRNRLIRAVIDEGELSEVEDDERTHPKVGALIADQNGKVLVSAHRGEGGRGDHAEFLVLRKAEAAGIALSDKVLFVTLEPCSRRPNPEKIPCAVRVVMSGLREVHFGTPDPNPDIVGRGENYLLSEGLIVERFPYAFAKELLKTNQEAFSAQRHLIAPVTNFAPIIEEIRSRSIAINPTRAGQREGLLISTLELIVHSGGPIWIFSGALSWLREMQVGLMRVALENREIRILCQKGEVRDEHFRELLNTARSVGASVGLAKEDLGLRGTIANPLSERASMISIERKPSLHGLVFRSPHETGLVTNFARLFETLWQNAEVFNSKGPRFVSFDLALVTRALKSGVRAYENSEITYEEIDFRAVQFLPRNIERLKLARVATLQKLRQNGDIPEFGCIAGSPWPLLPPIVERNSKGVLSLIDGSHRAYYWLQANAEVKERALVVNNVETSLPAVPTADLNDIRVTTEKWDRARRYVGYDSELFRPIRSAIERELRITQVGAEQSGG